MTVAYIDSFGDACFEGIGSCSNYNQGSCDPMMDGFIVQDGLRNNLSYVDFEGELCLTGGIRENLG